MIQLTNSPPRLASTSLPQTDRARAEQNIHRHRTPRDPPPLLHARHLALPARLVLAQHVVVIELPAAVADEERC